MNSQESIEKTKCFLDEINDFIKRFKDVASWLRIDQVQEEIKQVLEAHHYPRFIFVFENRGGVSTALYRYLEITLKNVNKIFL